MKLSEAILLGDSLKKADPTIFLHPDKSCGCALGGAALAIGMVSLVYPAHSPRFLAAFPWFNAHYSAEIGYRYNQVAVGLMTLEQLVDYVRSIEPAEESTLPDISLAEQYRAEEEAAAEEGALIEASGYQDPAYERNGR